jgi:diamine N-acetyltransferase
MDDILRLRAVEPADADAMFEIESDSTQWLDNDLAAPYSRENLRNYAKRYMADPYLEGQVRLIIETVSDHRLVGLIDLYELSSRNRTGYIGLYIKREERRKGYGLSALNLLEEYAKKMLNLRAMAARVIDSNDACHALFKKAEYEEVGVMRAWIEEGKKRHDVRIYEKIC